MADNRGAGASVQPTLLAATESQSDHEEGTEVSSFARSSLHSQNQEFSQSQSQSQLSGYWADGGGSFSQAN